MKSMLSAKRSVMKQVKGKDPRSISYWFLDKSLTLLHESQVPKAEVLKYIEEHYQ
jgi:hypothetical protein